MPLTHLGQTRSSHKPDHLLQTPDTFVRAVLPGMTRCVAIVHSGPARGSGFAQYTAEMQAGGTLAPSIGQRFLYVLGGEITIGDARLPAKSFAYVPEDSELTPEASLESRIAVIEKPYEQLPDLAAPEFFTGHEDEVEAKPLGGDPSLLVRSLVPDHPRHDFAVNTMTYQPGASLSMVELHIMEHGLLMLEGEGIYRLGDCWYPVTAGDFIWMAPYCPQWFGALGKVPAKYLIYKDWNRHAL